MSPPPGPVPDHEASFPPVPGSVGAARRFVRDHLAGSDQAELAALLVSELATNAVRHASTDFTVRLRLGEALRVEVADALPLRPAPMQPAPDMIGGRGLQILDALAARWGSDLAGAGKVVWFEL